MRFFKPILVLSIALLAALIYFPLDVLSFDLWAWYHNARLFKPEPGGPILFLLALTGLAIAVTNKMSGR